MGSRLVRRLAAEGRSVRALARRPERVESLPGVEAVEGDLLGEARLADLLDGCETAYYLVHSMEGGTANGGGFAALDRRAATTFAEPPWRPGWSGSCTWAASPRPEPSRPI